MVTIAPGAPHNTTRPHHVMTSRSRPSYNPESYVRLLGNSESLFTASPYDVSRASSARTTPRDLQQMQQQRASLLHLWHLWLCLVVPMSASVSCRAQHTVVGLDLQQQRALRPVFWLTVHRPCSWPCLATTTASSATTPPHILPARVFFSLF